MCVPLCANTKSRARDTQTPQRNTLSLSILSTLSESPRSGFVCDPPAFSVCQRTAWKLRGACGKGGSTTKVVVNVASLTLARTAGAAAARLDEDLNHESEWYESVDDLKDGSYGKEALRRRFNDLDSNGKGYVTPAELKVALEKLQVSKIPRKSQGFCLFPKLSVYESLERIFRAAYAVSHVAS